VRRQIERAATDVPAGRKITIRPPAIVVAGYVAVGISLFFVFITVAFADDYPVPHRVLWGLNTLIIIPMGLAGWLIAKCTSLTIDAEGLTIVNPLNTAQVPWLYVTNVDEDFLGIFRVQTREWSMRATAVQASNWEGGLYGQDASTSWSNSLVTSLPIHETAHQQLATRPRGGGCPWARLSEPSQHGY
jgi:hypothetical protein